MTTTATQEHRPRATRGGGQDDIFRQLEQLAGECGSKWKFYRQALAVVARHFGSPYAAIRVAQPAGTLEERVTSETADAGLWEPVIEDMLLESQAENSALARLYRVGGDLTRAVLMAVPVCEASGQPTGASRC